MNHPERAILAAASATYLLLDAQDRVVYANRALGESPGGTSGDPAGRDVREVLCPLVFEGEGLSEALHRVRRTGERCVLVGTRPDVRPGFEAHWEIVLSPAAEADGAVLVEVADVTRREAQRRWLENYQRFAEDVLRSLGSGLAVVDEQGQLLVANDAAAQILETSPEALREAGLAGILGDQAARAALAEAADAPGTSAGQMETLRRLPSGREIHLGYRLSPLTDRSGRRIGTIVHFRDVTELQRLKRQMIQQEKMAAVGQLAGGVAHEFNNLIGGMMGYAQLAHATREPADVEKCLNVVFDSTRRAKAIVGSLLAFARRPEGVEESIRLTDLIDQALVLVERSIAKAGIRIERYDGYGGFLQVDASRLQLVILNLIVNARDSMGKGGVLTIRTRQEGTSAVLAIEDTGSGIPPGHLHRVFEPFFTTKGALGGSATPGHGLGLYVSYGVVRELGGTIEVESEIGRGSRFTVAIPIAGREAGAAVPGDRAPADPEPSRTRSRRVLILDPDPRSRAFVVGAVRRMGGFQATGVPDWDAARDTARGAGFDLVLVNVARGREEDDEVEGRREFEIENPDIRVVECRIDGTEDGQLPSHLAGPHRLREIVRALERIADQESEPPAPPVPSQEMER